MRCLVVEDEPARVAAILPELKKQFGEAAVDVAEDRDSACDKVSKYPYDLIILDQRIPSAPGQLNPDVAHGRAVLQHVRQMAPETPVYFLTALPMEESYVDELMAMGHKSDVFGAGNPIPLVLRFQKSDLTPFYRAVEQIAATARATSQIEINAKGARIDLTEEDSRLLRCFARLQDGVCADIELINDGLSGARVLKVDVKDAHGEPRMSAVGKIGAHEAIAREVARYQKEVVRLPGGAYAPLLPPELPRVVARRAAFYRLLEGFDASLFDVLRRSDDEAAICVQSIQENEAAWARRPATKTSSIGDLAKLLIWEDRLPKIHSLLDGMDWQEYEAREITVNMCTRHGDLHGENARANAKLHVMLLDYGSVDPLPSALDAVTLELSPFFHPHGHRELLKWKTGDGEIDWSDREAFIKLTAVPKFVNAARNWAHDSAFGDREVLACAYIYVLRQLQFERTDKSLAREVLRGIVARGLSL